MYFQRSFSNGVLMKFLVLLAAVFSFSVSAFAEGECAKLDPSNVVKSSGNKAIGIFNSMDPMTAKSGSDSLGRVWFTEKSKSIELSECNVGDCTYTRSRVSRCVKSFNSRVDCLEQDESNYYCIDYR
jgi:hypothetical protein